MAPFGDGGHQVVYGLMRFAHLLVHSMNLGVGPFGKLHSLGVNAGLECRIDLVGQEMLLEA
jgi:hypothetical protein